MSKKLYARVFKYIRNNITELMVLIIILSVLAFPLPVTILGTGGIEEVSNRIDIDNSYKSKGKIYTSYVSEYKPNVSSYILAKINKFDIYKNNESNDSITDRLLFDESLNNAIYVGYKKALKKISIIKANIYVNYILKEANTNLKLNDQILEINGKKINNLDDIKNIKLGKKVNIKVKNNNKYYNRYAYPIEYNNKKIIGFSFSCIYEFNKNNYHIKSYEGLGPSGGLMTSLDIYNRLTPYDITNGKNISGTGTIDLEGNVGAIGGVKWKVLAADKENISIFFVPSDNLEEALDIKKDKKLKINIVSVKNIDDAINYLKQG